MVSFKQICTRCRKNYVVTSNRNRFPVCYECHKSEMAGEITDPGMKELFDIPLRLYEQNSFLRDIKIKYLKYGSLSENQVAAFKKTVEKMLSENRE